MTARKHLPSQIAQARYTLRNRETKIQRSSVVERSAVNAFPRIFEECESTTREHILPGVEPVLSASERFGIK